MLMNLLLCWWIFPKSIFTHHNYSFPYSPLPISYSQLPTPSSLLPTPNSQLPTSYSLLPAPYFLLPTPSSLLPAPYFLLPTLLTTFFFPDLCCFSPLFAKNFSKGSESPVSSSSSPPSGLSYNITQYGLRYTLMVPSWIKEIRKCQKFRIKKKKIINLWI